MAQNMFSLTEKVALVTGGNSGLGRAIALGLRAAGAAVVATGRDHAKNDAMRAELGDRAAVLELEVRKEDQVREAVHSIVERWGRIDILVNNAGLFRGGSVLELSLEDWEAVIGTHLTGTFLCSKHVAKAMADQGQGGKIINIGSMYSLFGPPFFADYAAAKTGILGLTRALAVELAHLDIQVNAILAGNFETSMTQGMPATAVGEVIRRKTPAGRWGDPTDLVGTVVFLSSRASDFVTGAAIPVDGGYSVADRLAE